MKTKKRIEELDFLKAFAMIMVVIGHTHCPSNFANIVIYCACSYFFHSPWMYKSIRRSILFVR